MVRVRKWMLLSLSAVILFSLVFYVNAEPVAEKMAQSAAQSFLHKEQRTLPKMVTKAKAEHFVSDMASGLTIGELHPIKDSHGEILAYIQELEPEGFIITSADDSIRPVLGFSFSGEFSYDAHNPLLNLIKTDTKTRLRLLSYGGEKAQNMIKLSGEQWIADTSYTLELDTSLLSKSISTLSETIWGDENGYIQTEWNQRNPWNAQCPYKVEDDIGGSRRPVGCVATATAQIINFWEYPKSVSISDNDYINIDGTSHYISTSSGYGLPSVSELRSEMGSLLYGAPDTDEQAYLCLTAGLKLHMNYRSKTTQHGGIEYGSAASTSSVGEVLTSNFLYGSADMDKWGNVWSENYSTIVDNMKNAQPVQIGIKNSGKTGGHSVIVDGYREGDHFFHVNFGWSDSGNSNTWYNIPNFEPQPYWEDYYYDVVHTVVFNIAKYQGWNQYGANAQNTFGTIYAAPYKKNEIKQKWRATCPSEFAFRHIAIGTSNHIYAAVSPNASTGHSFIYVIDQFGTKLKEIEINRDGKIDFMCQDEAGDLFVAVEDGYIYRVDPETSSAVQIFEEPYGGQINTLKIDKDGWLFAVTFDRVYALTRSGTSRWPSPFVVPSGSMFMGSRSIPAIDVSRQRIYATYYNSTTDHAYLVAINRLNGEIVQVRDFAAISVPLMKVPSIGPDGTVYIGMPGILYALNPDDFLGTPKWTKSLLISHTPAVGRDGTLYFPYWEQIADIWYNKLGAFDPSNCAERWSIPFQLDTSEESIFQPYIGGNGVVLFTIEHDGSPKTYTLHGYKDNGSSSEELWDYNAGSSGGNYAFGPGRTVYAWGMTGLAKTIYALTDGEIGDPYGAGMDFENNNTPIPASNPSPADGAVEQSFTSVQLSWSCSDPDGHDLKYDIYGCALVEGEEAAMVPLVTQLTENSYTLSNLQGGTEYLWMVVATDGQAIAEGPTWSFTTEIEDLCPDDPNKTEPGICGCGVPDTDTDGDETADCIDAFPSDPTEWADNDNDNIGDNADTDDDDDGMPDVWEEQYEGLNPLVDDASDDLDGDGILNLTEYQNGTDPARFNSKYLPFIPLLLGD